MARTKSETSRRIEEFVKRAAEEYVATYGPQIDANPKMKLTEVVKSGDPMALWFTYVQIEETETLNAETKTLKRLTVVLIVLTAVLIGLTAVLAWSALRPLLP